MISRSLIQEHLLEGTGPAVVWPNDTTFARAWLSQPVYRNIKSRRVEMILSAINARLHSAKQEPVTFEGTLTVEHVLPIAWAAPDWPDPPSHPDPEDGEETAEELRNRLLHTFGNLTLLTQPLNSSVSNGPYEKKRAEITKHSLSRLNAWFQTEAEWNESKIQERGKVLLETGAALLRRRPKGLLPAVRQELLDPSKAWWGGRRVRLADRLRYSISVSLGVVPLVLPRRGSPSTHRSRGWLRSTRSFRTASAPTKLATRRIRTRAWMKQGCCVAPACTSELHPVADQVPHAPSMTPVAMEHRHRLADVLGHVDEVDYHTVRSTAALARSSCVSAPSTSATHPGAQPAPSRRSSPGGVPADAAASARHRRPPRPDRRPPPGCVDRGVLAEACASTPGPVGAAPVRARSHSSAGLRAMRGRLWRQRRRPRPPHTAPGRGEQRCEPRLASLNSPATAGPCWAPYRHGGSVGPCELDRWWHPTRPRRHVPRTSSSLLRPSQRHLPSQGTVPKRRANVQGGGGDDRSVRAP